MSDPEIVRLLDRLNASTEQRHRDAADQSKDLVNAVAKGFDGLTKAVTGLTKVISDGVTLIEHTIIDEMRRR